MSNNLCIYHGGCDDGFGAAWVVQRFYGPDVDFHAGFFDKPLPDVKGKNVIMVDFSYKAPGLKKLFLEAESVVWLDHHKTAVEEWEKVLEGDMAWFEEKKEDVITLDMNHSGAMLAWLHFFPDLQPPRMITFIEDRDLWKFKYGAQTKNFSMALRSYPYKFRIWNIVNQNVQRIINEGESINRFYNQKIGELIPLAFKRRVGGIECLCVNAPWAFASDLAGELAKEAPVGVTFFLNKDGDWQFSLRSKGDTPEDVSRIAVKFGGGGHHSAAGFKMDHDTFVGWMK